MQIINPAQIVKIVATGLKPASSRWKFQTRWKFLFWETKEGWYYPYFSLDGPYTEDQMRYDHLIVIIDGKPFNMPRHTIYYSNGTSKTTIHDTYEQAVTFAKRDARGIVNPIIIED